MGLKVISCWELQHFNFANLFLLFRYGLCLSTQNPVSPSNIVIDCDALILMKLLFRVAFVSIIDTKFILNMYSILHRKRI